MLLGLTTKAPKENESLLAGYGVEPQLPSFRTFTGAKWRSLACLYLHLCSAVATHLQAYDINCVPWRSA